MADTRHDWFLSQVFHHRAALHRYLGKLTSGAQDIEDLVQEAYVRIYALPDYQRTMVILYHTEGLSYDEIAEVLSLPIGTVKSRLNRARLTLREKLEPLKELF